MFGCRAKPETVDTREGRDPFPLDTRLRQAGWSIADRRGKEPLWTRDHGRTLVPQSRALASIDMNAKG